MEAVLFVIFLLAFVLVAPPYVVAFTATGLMATSLVVQSTASVLSGGKVSLSAAFRTLVLTFLLSMLTAFAAMTLLLGVPPPFQHALTSLGAQAFTFGAYIIGFRIGLRLEWLHAVVVATVSSLIIGACIWMADTLLSPQAGAGAGLN